MDGTMPRDLGKLLSLRWISVPQNQLQDDLTFISSLTNCTRLQLIDAGDNLFRGSLPDSIANLSTYLSWIDLHNNQIHGIIPLGIVNLLNLTVLSMSANNLASPIPSSIGRLQKLHALYLDQNKFTELPSSLGNLTSLITLYLHENNIHGGIPLSLGNCHSLLTLLLHKNNLYGSIPPEIMSLSSISTFLTLDHNALTGSLPSKIGSLKNLGYMDVSYNRLSGPIPNTLGSCLSLEWLKLEANSFEGEIPQSLSMLRGLRWLDLLCNNLSGQIPSYLVFQNGSAISVVGNNALCGGTAELDLPPKLLKATNGFSEANLIGLGSYASVHKGILNQVQMVMAVKVGVGDHEPPEKHRNLKLIQRLDISIDVASALEYLHCGCESTIIHGDLKPSNVLLDDEMTAHIGDFGLAKIISTVSSDMAQGPSNSVAIRGTIGYVAPEVTSNNGLLYKTTSGGFSIFILAIFNLLLE
ncbi:unnamed protein product [Camellia sinensis]